MSTRKIVESTESAYESEVGFDFHSKISISCSITTRIVLKTIKPFLGDGSRLLSGFYSNSRLVGSANHESDFRQL